MSLTPSSLSRRRLLALAGATVGLCATDLLDGGISGAATGASAAACETTSAGEEGPFFVETKLLRSDVRANSAGGSTQAGVPLTFTVTVRDNDCGTALPGAYVDLWQANAQGVYSDETSESTTGDDWLRGYQITDSAGQVNFTTIYPGWYSGRTDHIHLRVRTYSGTAKTLDFETQIMFDDTVTSGVLATSAYQRSQSRDTTNSNDRVYAAEESEHGVVIFDTLTGNPTDGYAGTLSVVVDAPATTTSTTATTTTTAVGGTTAGSTGTTSAAVLTAALSHVSVTALRLRRHRVTVRLANSEKVRVDARLYKSGRLLARTLTTSAAGSHRVSLTAPRGATGKLVLAFYLTSASGRKKLTRTVTVG